MCGVFQEVRGARGGGAVVSEASRAGNSPAMAGVCVVFDAGCGFSLSPGCRTGAAAEVPAAGGDAGGVRGAAQRRRGVDLPGSQGEDGHCTGHGSAVVGVPRAGFRCGDYQGRRARRPRAGDDRLSDPRRGQVVERADREDLRNRRCLRSSADGPRTSPNQALR